MSPHTAADHKLVLSVDSDEARRESLSQRLQDAGYVVHAAATGSEALGLLQEMPAVVLLRVKLPDMSGLEVARRIKANPLSASIPIIHLSATAISPHEQANGLRGAEAYLVEPVETEHLLALMAALRRYGEGPRQAIARYREALRASGIGVGYQDLNGRYTWVHNPGAGVQPSDMLGKTDADLFSPEDAAKLASLRQAVLATGRNVRQEVALTLPGGQRVYDLSVEPDFGPDQAIRGFFGAAVDVTGYELANEALADALRAAERAADRVARLQAATAALSEALTPQAVVRAIIEQAVHAVRAQAGLVSLLTKDGRTLEPAGAIGYPPRYVEQLRQPTIGGDCITLEVVQSGVPVWLESREAVAARYPSVGPQRLDGLEALAILPLSQGASSLGVLVLSFSNTQYFDPDDQALLLTLAQQCAQALERARLYELERQAHRLLEAEVARRTAQLEQEAQRRRLAQQQLEKGREAERARIALELHDELGGALTGLKMGIRQLKRCHPEAPAGMLAELDELSGQVDGAVRSVRRLATEMRPAVLDDFGLVAALQSHFQEFLTRTGLAGQFESEVEDLPLAAETASACYRIFQETLTNVARHAEATAVTAKINMQADCAVIQVTDNGRGMDPATAAKTGHLGLVGMRERAELVSGTLDIHSAPQQGTSVLLKVPCCQP